MNLSNRDYSVLRGEAHRNSDSLDIRLIAGCMTGTSLDGLDVSLVEIGGRGLTIKASIVRSLSLPLGELTEPLRRLSLQEPMTVGKIAEVARNFGLLHLEALRELLDDQKANLVVIHGQTVFHKPPLSCQLINPAPVANGLGVPVVYDLRAADLAAGGEGAPITPLADFVLFRGDNETRCVVNLGGYCNVTIIPNITGRDICSCNQLLNRIAGEFFQEPFDKDGLHASQGKVQAEPYKALIRLLNDQAKSKRSLGTGDEPGEWLKEYLGNYKAQDIARTACAAVAETIVNSCKSADRLILAGGSVKNRTLVNEIQHYAGVPVSMSDEFGVPAQYREAVCMAVLGALCQDRIPITLPQVTGVDNPPISGSWILP